MKLSTLTPGQEITLTSDTFLTIKEISKKSVSASFTLKNFNYTADVDDCTPDALVEKVSEYGVELVNDL